MDHASGTSSAFKAAMSAADSLRAVTSAASQIAKLVSSPTLQHLGELYGPNSAMAAVISNHQHLQATLHSAQAIANQYQHTVGRLRDSGLLEWASNQQGPASRLASLYGTRHLPYLTGLLDSFAAFNRIDEQTRSRVAELLRLSHAQAGFPASEQELRYQPPEDGSAKTVGEPPSTQYIRPEAIEPAGVPAIAEVTVIPVTMQEHLAEQKRIAGLVEQLTLASRTLDPFWKGVLVSIILLIVGGIYNPILDFAIKRHLESASSPQAETKAIKQAAIEAAGNPDVLDDFRFVSVEVVSLRSSPGSKAPVIGTLRLGQAVVLLDKRDNGFSLVSWSDEEGRALVQGWMYSRYLKRFVKPSHVTLPKSSSAASTEN